MVVLSRFKQMVVVSELIYTDCIDEKGPQSEHSSLEILFQRSYPMIRYQRIYKQQKSVTFDKLFAIEGKNFYR